MAQAPSPMSRLSFHLRPVLPTCQPYRHLRCQGSQALSHQFPRSQQRRPHRHLPSKLPSGTSSLRLPRALPQPRHWRHSRTCRHDRVPTASEARDYLDHRQRAAGDDLHRTGAPRHLRCADNSAPDDASWRYATARAPAARAAAHTAGERGRKRRKLKRHLRISERCLRQRCRTPRWCGCWSPAARPHPVAASPSPCSQRSWCSPRDCSYRSSGRIASGCLNPRRAMCWYRRDDDAVARGRPGCTRNVYAYLFGQPSGTSSTN